MTFYPNPAEKKMLQLVSEILWPKCYCICSFLQVICPACFALFALSCMAFLSTYLLSCLTCLTYSCSSRASCLTCPCASCDPRSTCSHASRASCPTCFRASLVMDHRRSRTLCVPHSKCLILNILMHFMSHSSCVFNLFWF